MGFGFHGTAAKEAKQALTKNGGQFLESFIVGQFGWIIFGIRHGEPPGISTAHQLSNETDPLVCLLTRCRFEVSAIGVESVRCCKPGERCTPEILRVLTQIFGIRSKPPTFLFPTQTLSSKP